MSTPDGDPRELLARSLQEDRIHSAYLLSGSGEAPREAARDLARGLVCRARAPFACEACADCRRSREREEAVSLDGSGRRGPLLRHVGDHPDLLWVERGAEDTRVRIGQIRALQQGLRYRAHEGGWRAGVVADADQMNQEAQNARLRLLEEPPPRTTVVLVARTPAGLLATLRSRCQRLAFRPPEEDPLADPARAELAGRLDSLASKDLPALLDWAAEYRGPRGPAAERAEELLGVAGEWLRRRVAAAPDAASVPRDLEAFRTLQQCRRGLVQRNANPQMVAERALLALREAAGR